MQIVYYVIKSTAGVPRYIGATATGHQQETWFKYSHAAFSRCTLGPIHGRSQAQGRSPNPRRDRLPQSCG